VYYYTVDQRIEISITIDKGASSVGAALILGPTRLLESTPICSTPIPPEGCHDRRTVPMDH